MTMHMAFWLRRPSRGRLLPFLLNVDNEKFVVRTTASGSIALKSCKTNFKCDPSHHVPALCGIINANSQLFAHQNAADVFVATI